MAVRRNRRGCSAARKLFLPLYVAAGNVAAGEYRGMDGEYAYGGPPALEKGC